MTSRYQQGDGRVCKRCGVTKNRHTAFAPDRAVCKTCVAADQQARQEARRRAAGMTAHETRRAAYDAARTTAAARTAARVPSLFDVTRQRLESAWGPYARWTRAQHAQHTDWLYALASQQSEEHP